MTNATMSRSKKPQFFSLDDYKKEKREVARQKSQDRREAQAENQFINDLINSWLNLAEENGLNGVFVHPAQIEMLYNPMVGAQALWEVEQWCENTGRGVVIPVESPTLHDPCYRIVVFPRQMKKQ